MFDPNVPSLSVYVDDMDTPLLVNSGTARSEVPMPTMMRIVNEGNSADDGFFAIDDISLTVDDSIDLSTTFTEGFESYPARTSESDDADPQGPWITTETDGTVAGGGRPLAPVKVQVVDSSVVTPRSGNKCLKLEAGQRAGVTLAWGVPPEVDVQITWWARVPASVDGQIATYLRMSLYGTEGGNSYAGDKALLGYGSRDATIGDETSLTYFATAWVDTIVDYPPDTWEEYRLITHNNQRSYSIIKSPSSANPQVAVDRAGFIGSAREWGPTFMAGWNSSNGTNHPPVYVDDIEIKSLVSTPAPLPLPYNVVIEGDRFTNVSILDVGGPVGKAVVDPRDNETILFTMDAVWPGGGIYRARKVASGTWSVDPTPIVTILDQPSGLAVAADGTLWWVHDFTMSLQRLKAPYDSNVPEEIISNFGSAITDDDPIDVTIAPGSFTGSLGSANMVVVADRGSDVDANNAIYLVNPSTTDLYQSTYTTFLVNPTPSILGTGNLNAITPLPQSGEVVTLSQDGWISAVNGDGVVRNIWPVTLWADIFGPAPSGAAIAADPTTGRLWIAEDLLDELWSVDPAAATQDDAPDQKEVSFSLIDTNQVSRQLDVHDPGMSFAPNGDFLVVSDGSTQNGGGRLIIFHNEPSALPGFSISSVARVAEGVQLTWQSAGAATYEVLRGTDVGSPASFQSIVTGLTTTQFTDTNAPAGAAFYRVVARP